MPGTAIPPVDSAITFGLLPADSFVPILSPEEIACWDHATVTEIGLRSELLMENACREALAVFELELGDPAGLSVLLFAGSGNNGGDAFGLARHLHDRGAQVCTLHTRPKQQYKGAAGYHLALARRAGVPLRLLPQAGIRFNPTHLFGTTRPDVVVDGLLGTGFNGELKPELRLWVDWINHFSLSPKGAFVLALDVPSGFNAATGQFSDNTVRATATVTFEAAKVGLTQPGATDAIGRLYVRPIGIPRVIRERYPARCGLLAPSIVRLAIAASSTIHKGMAGRILVVGGSMGLTGAATLAGLGALRAGAGLVTLACPAELATEVKAGFPELMTLPLGHGSQWRAELVEELLPHLETSDALVLGPGLGRDPNAHTFLAALLAARRPATVVDADALFFISQHKELGTLLGPKDVLTPHPGEMANLMNTETAIVVHNRLCMAIKLAQKYKVVSLLKGAGTIVTSPTGMAYISPFACPNLAVGGSGDVLAGLLATLLGRGLPSLPATCLAVYWHGFSGKLLTRTYPLRGNLAREIAQILPWALKELHDTDSQRHHGPFTNNGGPRDKH
ncbi:ADP-dependent (S)-NAD(P)H-hydrate dehydratase / NAD(P)H-hydrate epimerase [Desulfovibrionales bacterium]